MPETTPKKSRKMTRIMKLCQKKRRNVKGSGYMREMNGICCHMKLRKVEVEDICTWDAGMGMSWEWIQMGFFEVVWILGLNVRIPPRCNPLQNPEAAGALT